ncbi:hypothetical protein B0H19DRAFT_663215 [Mycena capillaripes]|nr:hypothetical protein B0H19DRAFT_663215 [Mycena capillaripes]
MHSLPVICNFAHALLPSSLALPFPGFPTHLALHSLHCQSNQRRHQTYAATSTRSLVAASNNPVSGLGLRSNPMSSVNHYSPASAVNSTSTLFPLSYSPPFLSSASFASLTSYPLIEMFSM